MSDALACARTLLTDVLALADAHDRSAVIDRATAGWAEAAARPALAEDAETARLAMVAASGLGRRSEAGVWRARALARASAAGYQSGIAGLLMAEALRLQAEANDDRPPSHPSYRVLDEAFAILEELRPAMGDAPSEGPVVASSRWVSRQYHEKRAFLLSVAGRWDEAFTEYALAERFVEGDVRGTIKVELGRRAAQYMAAEDGDPARIEARERTAALGEAAASLGKVELAELAAANAAAMAAGAEALTTYETL